MRSYRNRKGDKVCVSKKHLDTAIAIKEELQKLSPTRKTSWAKHRKMMQQEGFFDSETNENYRCLIKSEQKNRGSLPNLQKHVDLVSDNKLKSIKHEIGELNSTKLELQQQGVSVRRIIRNANKDILFLEEIKDAIGRKEFKKPIRVTEYKKNDNLGKRMIVCLSDIHYGAYVDITDNYYDTEECAKLLDIYAKKITELIKKENVKSVYIMNLGDLIEHAYMRNQNLYNAEETLSEQIVNISDLIIQFIEKIAALVPVKYSAIAGNHDRLQGDKNSNLNADHVVRISNKIIQTYIKYAKSRVTYVEAEDYYHAINIGKFNFCFVHGDLNRLQKKTTLAELSALHDTQFDAVIGGHIHHFTMTEVGKNKYQVTFGSIKGIDEYSVNIIGAKSSRSQGVILVDKDDFEIRKIGL